MLLSDGILGSLEMSGGCLEDVWGYLSGNHGNLRRSDLSPQIKNGDRERKLRNGERKLREDWKMEMQW